MRRSRETGRPQHRGLPAGDHADDRRPEAVGRARRALRSSRPRRQRQLARAQGRGRADSFRRRRQRVGHIGAVLAVGEALSKQPRRRNVLLAFWSGEELGLLGSAAFAAQPPVPLDQLAAYLNFDMVGRMQDNKLTVQALGTSPAWARIIEQANVAAGFDLQVQPDPYQPTDVATFNQAGVPVPHVLHRHPRRLSPPDRHRRQDRLRGSRSHRRLRRRHHAAARRARRSAGVHQVRPADAGRLTRGVRVFTGTIPDYTSDVKGPAARRRDRRRPRRTGRPAEGRRHRGDRRVSRSPTSTTTPTRSSCSRSASR